MRLISTEDLTEISRWLLAMHDESPVFKEVPVNIKYSLDALHQALSTDTMFGIIEPGAGMMLGMCSRTWYDPRIHAFEQLIYITPERRGGMLAARLIKAFEVECKNRGAIDVAVGNSAGISDSLDTLYIRLGYEDKYGTLTKRL